MPDARYRGQHRKPSTLSTVGAVGVGVSTLAAAVILPTATAHAATDVQWERVAHCESGDNWHDNTGNGYYGGLQFASSTWTSFDTNHFAARADLASRSEQIIVADRVLNRQGWGAWPVCSHYAGAPGPADAPAAPRVPAPHKPSAGRHAAPKSGPLQSRGAKEEAKWVHYTVQGGDTLSAIASRHNIKGGWRALYRVNRRAIGDDPGLIHIGDRLRLHARTTA